MLAAEINPLALLLIATATKPFFSGRPLPFSEKVAVFFSQAEPS